MNRIVIQNKSFLSFFSIQFLGAFNDNLFKNALVILITFHSINIIGMESQVLVTFAFGLFILPFFLFSALAGQIADKYPKSTLICYINFCEIIVMFLAMLGLYFQHYPFLLLVLFLMGMQSTFFGPVKYSILPNLVKDIIKSKPLLIDSNQEKLRKKLLVQANGLVEMGTFAAILCGTILGGILSSKPFLAHHVLPISLLCIAAAGWVLSFYLPEIKAADREVKINFNLWIESKRVISHAKENLSIFRVVLLISWFWFIGASVLSQLPSWTKTVLNADEYVVTILLTCFSLGVGLGSILCSKLHGYMSYSRLSQLGNMGISISLLLFILSSLFYSVSPTYSINAEVLINYWSFGFILVYLSIISLGFFGGLYIVPLYYFIQEYSIPATLSRVIAANNIFNALFMVVSSILLSLLLIIGVNLPVIFLILSIFNVFVVYRLIAKDKRDVGKQQHFFDLD